MADFCRQCSIDIFGKDYKELAGLGRGRRLKKDHGWPALCEGCGSTLVNAKGECIVSDCLKNGHKIA